MSAGALQAILGSFLWLKDLTSTAGMHIEQGRRPWGRVYISHSPAALLPEVLQLESVACHIIYEITLEELIK